LLCQQCQKRVANVYFKQTINDKKVEMYLCEKCAAEKGQTGFMPHFNLGDFFWGISGLGGSSGILKTPGQPAVERCNVCGMSFEDFRESGKLGCGNCYRVFRNRLAPILRRIHGNVEHKGKIPGQPADNIIKEIQSLKAKLDDAILNEEYEKAAVLRDKIRELESSSKQFEGGAE